MYDPKVQNLRFCDNLANYKFEPNEASFLVEPGTEDLENVISYKGILFAPINEPSIDARFVGCCYRFVIQYVMEENKVQIIFEKKFKHPFFEGQMYCPPNRENIEVYEDLEKILKDLSKNFFTINYSYYGNKLLEFLRRDNKLTKEQFTEQLVAAGRLDNQ